jgi:hypothetical protein
MAEPTDRSAPPTSPAYIAAPEPQRPTDPQLYRPLSLTALIGFSAAVLYTVFLLLIALVALVRHSPLLIGSAALVLPLLTLGVSVVGWLQVQRSDGTKAGSGLALWGMLLSLLTCLSYGAYYYATFLAIHQQAEPFVLDWFEKVKAGKVDEAFCLTLSPSTRPPEGPNRRRDLEMRFNTGPDGSGRGRLSMFSQSELVRFVEQGGETAKVIPLGVNEWTYQEVGYRVRQTFQVTMPQGSFQVMVTTHGSDAQAPGQARQWRVVIEETAIKGAPEPTPLARRMMELMVSSNSFSRQWVQKFGEGKIEEAYLDTRAPEERTGLRKTFQGNVAAARLAAAFSPGNGGPDANPNEARLLLLPGYRAFYDGGLVQADPEKFWAPDAVRSELPEEVKKVFSLEPGTLPGILQPENIRVPLWTQDAKNLRVAYEYQLVLMPKYTATAALIVEGDLRTVDDAKVDPAWRLAALDLRRGGLLTGIQRPPR